MKKSKEWCEMKDFFFNGLLSQRRKNNEHDLFQVLVTDEKKIVTYLLTRELAWIFAEGRHSKTRQ